MTDSLFIALSLNHDRHIVYSFEFIAFNFMLAEKSFKSNVEVEVSKAYSMTTFSLCHGHLYLPLIVGF